jgi:hypothetical protein
MSKKTKSSRLIQTWPFFLFFGFSVPVSFVYSGIKHKQRRLVVTGVVYGVLLALAFAISEPTGGTAEELSDTAGFSYLTLWIVGTIHAFRINKQNRTSGSIVESDRIVLPTNNFESINSETSEFDSLSNAYFVSPSAQSNFNGGISTSPVQVDVNTADLHTLLTVLNLSPSSAEQVLSFRLKNGGFSRIEDFVTTAGLKPHDFAKIRDRVTVVPIESGMVEMQKSDGSSSSGRVLDL